MSCFQVTLFLNKYRRLSKNGRKSYSTKLSKINYMNISCKSYFCLSLPSTMQHCKYAPKNSEAAPKQHEDEGKRR